MKNFAYRKIVLLIIIAIVIVLEFFAFQGVSNPIFITNKTPSVPLGTYTRVLTNKYCTLLSNCFVNVSRDRYLYVAINPIVLLQEYPMLSKSRQHKLQEYGKILVEKRIVLLKRLSFDDAHYFLATKKLPARIRVESSAPNGIDSRQLGLIDKNYVFGVYVRVGERE